MSGSHTQAIGLTAIAFVLEQREGMLDRTWAAGARTSEVLFAHVVTQLGVLVGQVTLMLFFAIYVFKVCPLWCVRESLSVYLSMYLSLNLALCLCSRLRSDTSVAN